MADPGYLDQVLGWLRGPQATAMPAPDLNKPSAYTPAPPLSEYPSSEDADYARKYGFGYGSGNEPYLNNEKARVIGQNLPVYQFMGKNKKPSPSANLFLPDSAAGLDVNQAGALATDPKKSPLLDLTAPANKDMRSRLNNHMMEAALAANRSPVAAIGFDPDRVALDTVMQHPSILGIYNPNTDSMYSAFDSHTGRDAITHESTHRGIELLTKAYPDKMKDLVPDGYMNEMIVRQLMRTQAGDPEKAVTGNTNLRERQDARVLFDDPKYGPARQKALNDLQELAIQYRKERNPRGPH